MSTNITSYLERLESYISQNNISLTQPEATNGRLLAIKSEHERNEFDEKGNIVSEAEKIFGAKAQPMSAEEKKIYDQVVDRALVYQVVDGHPKVLVYKRHD